MSQQSRRKVWKLLDKYDLIEGEVAENAVDSPWYIKLLLSISGWFGASFLVLFVGGILGLILGRNVENFPLLLLFIGGGLIFFAYTIFKERQNDFLEHFMLALSITGQVMVIASLFFMFDNRIDTGIIFVTAIFQAFLMWVIPNYIHRMMSSFFMTLAFSYLFYKVGEPLIPTMILTFVVAWLWMNEFNFKERKKVEAIAYGQTVALFTLKYSLMGSTYYLYELFSYSKNMPKFHFWWLEVASIMTLVYVLWMILKEAQKEYDTKSIFLLFGAVMLLGFLSFEVGGLVLGVMLLLIGFAHSHRLLMGLGILSSLTFLSYYYYYLGETLMDKAEVLAFMGVALLLSYLLMKVFLKQEVSDV